VRRPLKMSMENVTCGNILMQGVTLWHNNYYKKDCDVFV